MATTVRTTTRRPPTRGMKYVSRRHGKKILDRQARKYLGMSGDEFVRKYRAGEILDPDRTDVRRVAMLIPLAD
jgi:hypothetical protein